MKRIWRNWAVGLSLLGVVGFSAGAKRLNYDALKAPTGNSQAHDPANSLEQNRKSHALSGEKIERSKSIPGTGVTPEAMQNVPQQERHATVNQELQKLGGKHGYKLVIPPNLNQPRPL